MSNKSIKLIMCVLIIGLFLTGCQEKNTDKEKDNDKKDSFQSIYIKKDSDCNKELELYYTVDNRKIYTYCLDSIKITSDNKSLELKEYLEINANVIDDIIIEFTDNNTNSYDDGGTILYKGDEFNLLRCHTLAGNNDIYIGDKNMGYPNNFCGNV